ncbi:MAG: polysaccharide deacetylase family protein [Candidatus Omnitrophica bacterium]|nr:polysaccharide deacetylase family protein [Candidatus Omnitrophota bacterium]MBU4334388.1 polysaccharide deacetylase family protein [Candidatus Omnitrophota bacterium]
MLIYIFIGAVLLFFLIAGFCVFFDQAILTRKGTIYRVKSKGKRVALTFDDGPSLEWTPKILDELKASNIKATFFLVGYHVQKYPDIARRIVAEGHEVGNHGYAHSVMFYYTPAEIEEEIKYAEHVIREITGVTTKVFRPPKAWLQKGIKEKIKSMGYNIVLWSLNSKDWVMFNHKNIAKYISSNIRNGDILLFHDSGNVTKTEGGKRTQTVKCISLLAKMLREKGYEFVTTEELING